MKITQQEQPFQPITITLENRDEALAMFALLSYSGLSDSVGLGHAYRLFPDHTKLALDSSDKNCSLHKFIKGSR